MRASDLSDLVYNNLGLYVFMYLLFVALYLLLFKKSYWGLFDPMFYTVVNEIGGAFCVWLMYYQGILKPYFGWSFIYTDIGLLIGIIAVQYIPSIKFTDSLKLRPDTSQTSDITEFDVFLFVVSIAYILVEMTSILTIGIVLFSDEENHVSVFQDHGILRAFVASYRILMTATLFYKKLILKRSWSWLDFACLILLLFGVLTSGSKGSILSFVWMYFIITFPLVYAGKSKQFKLSLPVIILLASFPVGVIMVKVGAGSTSALQQLYIRLLASGDIFLLGYYDSVMATLTETSFVKYALYPGWGSILKNLGFQIKPPRLIGSDIFEFYTGQLFGGGPNARHNYLGLHFFGFYGSILYSFIIGAFVGYFRSIFKHIDPQYVSYIAFLYFVLIAYYMSTIIDDLNFFINSTFWSSLFLFSTYFIAKLIFLILKALSEANLNRQSVIGD